MALKIGRFSLERLSVENIYSTYLGMTSREQTIALVSAAVVVVMIIIMPIAVASSRITRLEKELADGNKQFREIIHTLDSYNTEKAKLTGLEKMLSSGFDSSISSTLEALAEKSGIKDKIDSLKEKPSAPSEILDEASVDVRLKKVNLQQLVDFLYAIQNDPDKLLVLKQLSMKTRFDNKQELDVSFTVSTFRMLEGATEGT